MGTGTWDFFAVIRVRRRQCPQRKTQGKGRWRALQKPLLRKKSVPGIGRRFRSNKKNRPLCITVGFSCWSGLRGSNSLPPPWQGGALPDELKPRLLRTLGYYSMGWRRCQPLPEREPVRRPRKTEEGGLRPGSRVPARRDDWFAGERAGGHAARKTGRPLFTGKPDGRGGRDRSGRGL